MSRLLESLEAVIAGIISDDRDRVHEPQRWDHRPPEHHHRRHGNKVLVTVPLFIYVVLPPPRRRC